MVQYTDKTVVDCAGFIQCWCTCFLLWYTAGCAGQVLCWEFILAAGEIYGESVEGRSGPRTAIDRL